MSKTIRTSSSGELERLFYLSSRFLLSEEDGPSG
jgi:hypothetical protein